METKFYSEKSVFFLLLSLIIPVAIICYAQIRYENSWFILVTMLLVMLVNLYLFFFTYYMVTEDKLIVKIGFITYKTIPLKDIKSIKEDKSVRKGLATSWKNRIEIFYSNTSVIVSPKNIEEFLHKVNS
ncbi:PH domain-containing protein [Myroides sp. LJL115]